jgi:hypothetical protein
MGLVSSANAYEFQSDRKIRDEEEEAYQLQRLASLRLPKRRQKFD